MALLHVTHKEITELERLPLVKLTHWLALHEAAKYAIPASAIKCNFNIDTGDGGEDLSINWQAGVDFTDYLQRNTLIQVKATKMPKTKCVAELLDKSTGKLKAKIDILFKDGGTYILVCNKDAKDDRLEAMQKVAAQNGYNQAKILIYNPTKIAEWVNKYFVAVAFAKELLGRPLPLRVQTWQKWSQYPEHTKTKFVSNDGVDKHLDSLRKAAATPRSVLRLCGLPGLGKSRLVVEAFSEEALKRLTAYIDASLDRDEIALNDQISSFIDQRVAGTMVVDNCSQLLHNTLARQVQHPDSKMSLITLDSDPHEVGRGQGYIELAPLDDDTIKKILKDEFPDMPSDDLDRITSFAEGFPQMAVLMCEADLRDTGSLSKLTPEDLVRRLLFPKGEIDKEAFAVISACALFDQFAFDDGKAGETELIARVLCAGMSVETFCQIALKFKRRQILEPHMGSYTKVTPKPLAWRLASDWWEACSETLADLLINEKWPESLANAMCNQLTFLRDTKAAQQVAEKLCSPDCPFASAESLSSSRGSRLLCALVEVNPEATLQCLERAFSNMTVEQLLEVTDGRRYLVYALQKLCWNADQFERAGFLLYRFGEAENENSISNNASGNLKQLFHVYLPGTKASLEQRLHLLDDMIDATSMDELILECMLSGFDYGHFSRTSGRIESQGGRMPDDDYEPTGPEIRKYWKSLLDHLIPMLANESYRRKVLGQFETMILYLVRFGLIDELESIIRGKIERDTSFWVEGLELLTVALKHEGSKLAPPDLDRVNDLINLMNPQSFAERYRQIVSEASYSNYDKDEQGHLVDANFLRAENFGKECGLKWPDWKDDLAALLSGEQREAPAFAKGLASTMPLDQTKEFVSASIDHLARQLTNSNATIVGEVLSELKETETVYVNEVLDMLETEYGAAPFTPWLIYRVGVDESTLDRYIRLLSKKQIQISALGSLMYGGVLKGISQNKMEEFVRFVSEQIPALESKRMALELIRTYSFQQEDNWICLETLAKEILTQSGFFRSVAEANSTMLLHNWETSVMRILAGADKDFARVIAEEIVSVCGEKQDRIIYRVDRTLQPVLRSLIKDYFEVCWPLFGNALSSADWEIRFDMKLLLTNGVEREDADQPILHAEPKELAEWCSTHKDVGEDLVRDLKIWEKGSSKDMSLNALGEALLETMGKSQTFLNQLSANLASTSMTGWGSLRPKYEARKALMEKLRSHRHSSVRKWAAKQIPFYEKRILGAKKREEEEKHGIFDGFLRDDNW